MNNNSTSAPQKQSFTGGLGFVLACIGGAVGLGNIWRFPVMISQFGGLTFLIPYLIFVCLIAFTGVIEEYALGRASGKGAIGAYGWACRDKGLEKPARAIGVLPIVGALGLAVGYSVVLSWIFYYLYLALTGQLMRIGDDTKVLESVFSSIACADGCSWSIVVVTACTLFIMGAGVAGGIEKANKVLLPALALLFTGLCVYIATLPGAIDGYKYIFTLELEKLWDPKLWIFACGQAFFSLSVTGNVGIIYGSYLPKNEDIPKSAILVAFFDTMAALLAALVIIPAVATTGTQLSIGGPGLMFIYLIDVFNNMPGGWLIECLFFLSVASAGVTTLITLYEVPIALATKKLHMSRWMTSIIIMATGCLMAVLMQGITSEWMDILSIYVCPIGSLLAAIAFFWMLPKEKALEAVNEGSKHPVNVKFHWTGKYVFCATTVVVLVAGALLGGIG